MTRDIILLNVASTLVISLYIFGGEKPWVSQTTAVAVGIIQVYSILVGAAVSGVVKPSHKKVEDSPDEDNTLTFGVMARRGFACALAYLSMLVQNTTFQRFGGMFAVLMLGRFLRMSGAVTTASQAIPLALALGMLLSIAARCLWPQDSSNEGCDKEPCNDSSVEDKSPYTQAFWSDLDSPTVNAATIDEVSLDPSDILSDVFYKLIMK